MAQKLPVTNYQLFFPHFLLLTTSIILFLFPSFDPDLGWHLRYGDHFFQTGKLLYDNSFTWTLPDFHWINHSWAYDIITSWLFSYGSFTALSITAALLLALSYYWTSLQIPSPFLKFTGLLIFATLCTPLFSSGLRSQIFSLCFASLLWLILNRHWHHRFYYLMPVFFLIWANLHGQFSLGLGIYTLYLAGQWYPDRTLPRHTFIGYFLSILATLINPWGLSLHLDIITYLGSPILAGVTEWQPWPPLFGRSLALYAYTGCIIYYLYRHKSARSLPQILILSIFFLLSLQARRMISWYLLLSLPFFTQYLATIISPSRLTRLNSLTFIFLITTILGTFYLQNPFHKILNQTWVTYCQSEIRCSEGAIDFLKQNHIEGKIFNAYRLGGHLIYRYPEQPIYIDGRMILWQDTQGNYLFDEYRSLVDTLPQAQAIFAQHNFDYIIINHEYRLATTLKDLFKWPIIYQDEYVAIFQNPIPK